MASDCYWCAAGTPGSVPSPIAGRNIPLGCCAQCQVLSCGHHAIRNKFKQEFKCWDCLVLTLIGSATDDPAITAIDRKALQRFDKELAPVVENRTTTYKDFDEFELYTPELKAWFPIIRDIHIDWTEWPQSIARSLETLPDNKQRLLIAAGLILSELEGTDRISETDSPFRHALLNAVNVKQYG